MKTKLSNQKVFPLSPSPLCVESHLFKKQLLFVAVFIAFAGSISAQSVVSTAGGTSKGKQLSLEWTLGEMSVETVSTSKGLHTQGFHQPLLIRKIMPVVPVVDELPDYLFKVAPNPVVSSFVVTIDSKIKSAVQVQLADAFGRVIYSFAPSQSKTFSLSLRNQPSGTYYLFLRDAKGNLLKTFSVIKAS